MNKKDFLTLIVCNIVSVILFVELLVGLEAAFVCLVVWTIISLVIHILTHR